jgi:NTP pyrophosphatase (non-canonical NTP hydrolase)
VSAHNCGCDPEEHWQCEDYPSCSYGKVIASLQAGIDAINNDDTFERLLFEAQPMSELTDVGAGYENNGGPGSMTLNGYQQQLHTYKPGNYSCHALGLVGELGEVFAEAFVAAARVADMVKKQEHHGTDKADPQAILKELGDVLWYVTAVAGDYGLTLQDVAEANIAKLRARYPRGFEKGGGIRNDVPESSAVGRDRCCRIPPVGWRCTRTPGHDGPCAAVPTTAPAVK